MVRALDNPYQIHKQDCSRIAWESGGDAVVNARFLVSEQLRLAAEVELLDNRLVAREGMLLQVVQQFAAAACHFQEATTGVEVLPMRT